MRGILRDIQQTEQTTIQPTTAATMQPQPGTQTTTFTQQQGLAQPQAQAYGQNIPITQQGFQQGYQQGYQPVQVEHRTLPTMVRETIVPQQTVQVQPVIHRSRSQTEVHKVIQPMRERDIAPTVVQRSFLPAETRTVTAPQGQPPAMRQLEPPPMTQQPLTQVVQRPPIIEERIDRKVIEEVQPVLYREVVRPVLVEQVRPIYEVVQEGPRYVSEQMPMRDLGVRTIQQPMMQPMPLQQPLIQPLQQPMVQPLMQRQILPPVHERGTLPNLPPRIVQASPQIFSDTTGFQGPTRGLPGNVVRVEYEVKQGGQFGQEPYVERTVYKEVPLSSLQELGYQPVSSGYGQGEFIGQQTGSQGYYYSTPQQVYVQSGGQGLTQSTYQSGFGQQQARQTGYQTYSQQ
jgi:hypothetical protein